MSSSSIPSSTPPTSDDGPFIIPHFRYTKTGRNKSQPADPFHRMGGQYARTIDMFALPSVIITAGLLRERAPEDEEYNADEERKWTIYQDVLQLDASIHEACKTPATMTRMTQLMQQGMAAVKSIDTNGIKNSLPIWWDRIRKTQQLPSGPIPVDKAQRGFGDPVCGMLLCPVELDWDDDSVKEELRAGTAMIDGKAVDGSDWPAFLHSSPINKSQLWSTFLRGPLLVRAYRHVFNSPSSAKSEADPDSTTAATRSGNAQLYGMTRVTRDSLAYIATQVLFSLTSLSAFNKSHKGLDAVRFFNSLIDYLYDPVFHSQVKDLLQWWNSQVFPHHFTDSSRRVGSAHERMKAALRASEVNE